MPSTSAHGQRQTPPASTAPTDTPGAPRRSLTPPEQAIPPVLSIAGSDSSGGAGIQADIKTMMACGVFAMTAVTALTAQNTMGVTAVAPVTPELLAEDDGYVHGHRAMHRAAATLEQRYGCSVLVKGGHSGTDADDVLVCQGVGTWFAGAHIATANTHGTGCTLSSAIASFLARGEALPDAVADAKAYLTGALLAGLDLGHGSGPMDHGWRWRHRPGTTPLPDTHQEDGNR